MTDINALLASTGITVVQLSQLGAAGLALSGDDIADLNQALIMGRRFVAEHKDG